MPRKQFFADVQVAADKKIDTITSVARGSDDGEVIATFLPPRGIPIEISLLAQPGTYFSITSNLASPIYINVILFVCGGTLS